MTSAANSEALTVPTTISLTRRGRFLFAGLPALLLAVILLASLMTGAAALFNQAQASSQTVAGVEAQEVTVSQGDTLWSIATSAGAGHDTQIIMAQIAELNDLSNSQLHPGQTLFVPAP